jgi:hypothetical protein
MKRLTLSVRVLSLFAPACAGALALGAGRPWPSRPLFRLGRAAGRNLPTMAG